MQLNADNEEILDAIHEAGHAVVHLALKRPFTRVRLAGPHGPARIDFDPVGQLTRDEVDREVICALAGVVAEAWIAQGRAPMDTVLGGLADHAAVRGLLGRRARDKKLVGRLLLRTLTTVKDNTNAIKRAAKALLDRRELSADEVVDVVASFALSA